MSNFNCDQCGYSCCDSPQGYVTGCQHYLPDTADFKALVAGLAEAVKFPDRTLLQPLPSFGDQSLLDLWNGGHTVLCRSIVHSLNSGGPT